MLNFKMRLTYVALLLCWGSVSLYGFPIRHNTIVNSRTPSIASKARSIVSKLKVRWGLSSPALPVMDKGIEGFDPFPLGSFSREKRELIKRSKMKRAKKMNQFRLGTLDPKSCVSLLPTEMITEIYAHLKKMDEDDLKKRIDALIIDFAALQRGGYSPDGLYGFK